jgi:predicted DCC family thiol-disulfide oxidoreductase YuxK
MFLVVVQRDAGHHMGVVEAGDVAVSFRPASIRVLAGLPHWSWSRMFLLLPRRPRDCAYDRIAGNRYRLFGRNESCLVPTSAIAARFVLDDPLHELSITPGPPVDW